MCQIPEIILEHVVEARLRRIAIFVARNSESLTLGGERGLNFVVCNRSDIFCLHYPSRRRLQRKIRLFKGKFVCFSFTLMLLLRTHQKVLRKNARRRDSAKQRI